MVKDGLNLPCDLLASFSDQDPNRAFHEVHIAMSDRDPGDRARYGARESTSGT